MNVFMYVRVSVDECVYVRVSLRIPLYMSVVCVSLSAHYHC